MINFDEYVELLRRLPPRPIRSEAERVAVQKALNSLIDSDDLTADELDYLNVLGTLMHEYEEQHVSIPDISGVELLKVLIQDFGLKQKDLVPIFKTESIVSAVLNGQRKLTVAHIEKLADFFGVSPAVFFSRSPSAL